MIFEDIAHITNKNAFLELINIYIRLVEVTAQRYNRTIPHILHTNSFILSELEDMGIVSDANQINALQFFLKKDYTRFISCVNFFLENKNLFDKTIYKLNNKYRRKLQCEDVNSFKPTFADFFAGAGGLSCGFTQAGFKVIFANDFEDVCIRTYRFNHPELPSDKIAHQDIRNIVDNIQDYITTNVDVVVGGPPCQGFSSANQQRIIDDPRNELYKYFIKGISKIAPKFVVMENVKGMLKVADQVVEDYHNIKVERDGISYTYDVGYEILNSADFGVAQSRERLIYIAIRTDIAKKNNISPLRIFKEIKQTYNGCHQYLLRDALFAIKPLDAPRKKNTNEIDDEQTGKKIDINHFCGDENEYLRLINSDRKIPFVFNHKARYVNDTNYDIYRLLNQGDDASNEKVKGIMPYENRLHCFKDKYYKLIANRPSRTITAHLKMDCHSHIHPYQIRAITPREAARCQSFPDDYLFLGAYLKTYMEIGNAVPCLMAKGIASIIKKYL